MTTKVTRAAIEAAKKVYLNALDVFNAALGDHSIGMAVLRDMADDLEAKYHAYRTEVHAYRKAIGAYAT